MEKELQRVTFEQAKRLKKAGFNWECDYFYLTGKHGEKPVQNELCTYGQSWNYNEYAGEYYSAPTVALALQWFRDEKELHGLVANNACGYYWDISKAGRNGTGIPMQLDMDDIEGTNDGGCFDAYEAAESALLDNLLTIIEEKV